MGGVGAILAAVPWSTVIDAAPSVIAGASKLLRQIGLTRAEIPSTDALTLIDRGKVDPQSLAKTVEALESSLVGLNAQMSDATRLIGELAEANRLLAARVYVHRLWLRLLAAGSLVTLSIAIFAVATR